MEYYSVTKKKEILSFAGQCIELENIILSEVRLRKPKAACSLSYVDYGPKTKPAILWDTGHSKGRSPTGRIGKGKETKKLNVVYMLLCKNEYKNLTLARATIQELGRREEDYRR
jgi:hypothetical protein